MSDAAKAGVGLPECVDGLPYVSGEEELIAAMIRDASTRRVYPMPESGDPFEGIQSAFAVALHMHQPLIPAGGDDLRTAAIISNLQYMMEHPDIGDNHNAPVFRWCYKRMGEFIPQLIDEGKQPRVMLDYSGTPVARAAQDGRRRRVRRAARASRAIRATGARWNGWAVPGATRWRLRRRSRTIGCTCGRGSITSRRCSASRRWAGCGASRRRRWLCPTIRTSPTSSSRR